MVKAYTFLPPTSAAGRSPALFASSVLTKFPEPDSSSLLSSFALCPVILILPFLVISNGLMKLTQDSLAFKTRIPCSIEAVASSSMVEPRESLYSGL